MQTKITAGGLGGGVIERASIKVCIYLVFKNFAAYIIGKKTYSNWTAFVLMESF